MHCTLALAPAASAGVAELRVGPPESPGAWVAWRPGRCFLFDEAVEHEVRMRKAAAQGEGAGLGASAPDSAPAVSSSEREAGGVTAAALFEDPAAWPFRAVLIVDIANPLLEPLSAFREVGVAAGAWAAHGEALEAAWHAVRAWGRHQEKEEL